MVNVSHLHSCEGLVDASKCERHLQRDLHYITQARFGANKCGSSAYFTQALVEMAEVGAAQTAVSFYAQRAPLLRGRVVYVQFSNHDQLVTEVSAHVAQCKSSITPYVVSQSVAQCASGITQCMLWYPGGRYAASPNPARRRERVRGGRRDDRRTENRAASHR